MTGSVKIRAHEVEGLVTIKSVINHPMETGERKVIKTGRKIPSHFIKEVIVSRNQRIVMEAFWGKSISRNPFLSLQIPGRKGDLISIAWLDNHGNSDSASARVR
jgi:sulfur-oxidizing protein SoxZ